MKTNIQSGLCHLSGIKALAVVAFLMVTAAVLNPAGARSRGTVGPDVICSRVAMVASGVGTDTKYYGTVSGVRAYAMASTSCNMGDTAAEWQDGVGIARNPVIAQNLYRLLDNRFEQIGMSWLKHSFCAVTESTCANCDEITNCDYLFVGCADTYWSDLNGQQNRLGPRWEVNPMGVGPGGVHDDVYTTPSGVLGGRLQVKETDIIPGSRYFAEIQYVTHDEAFSQRWNNASWREMYFNGTTLWHVILGPNSVHREESAINAWKFVDPNVTLVHFEDDPGMGRMTLGYLVTDNGDGTWTYEYALHNHNSDRAARSFSVPKLSDVTVVSTGFHDVDYHSNDGWNGTQNFDPTDWAAAVGSTSIEWDTADFDTDPNANALRWGTLYNYRITARAEPQAGNITVAMYKGGGRSTVDVPAMVPGPAIPFCPADLTGPGGSPDGIVNVTDLFALLANWNTSGPGADLAAPTNVVDVSDLFVLLADWGTCD